jgi:hypothetical protein
LLAHVEITRVPEPPNTVKATSFAVEIPKILAEGPDALTNRRMGLGLSANPTVFVATIPIITPGPPVKRVTRLDWLIRLIGSAPNS